MEGEIVISNRTIAVLISALVLAAAVPGVAAGGSGDDDCVPAHPDHPDDEVCEDDGTTGNDELDPWEGAALGAGCTAIGVANLAAGAACAIVIGAASA